MATKKVTSAYTTASGQKVVKYSDGSKTYDGKSSSGSSSSKSSSSSLSSSQEASLQSNLKTLQSALNNSALSSAQKKDIQTQISTIEKSISSSSSSKEEKAKQPESSGFYDDSSLRATDEFKALNSEDQQAVLAVFGAVAGNDKVKADRLAKAFAASSKINDPYFAQQLRLAQDAIERGYVAIDKEAAYAEMQARNRLTDLKADYENKRQFLTAEQASTFKDIERTYTQNLDTMRQDLASSGLSSSSQRGKKETILSDATGDLRESTNRKFEFEQSTIRDGELRSERDTAEELARLSEVTASGKLDFLRKAEAQVGSDNLPTLSGAPSKIGGIYGSLPEQKLQNTIDAAKSFVF